MGSANVMRSGPEVEPFASWKIHGTGGCALAQHRSDQQIGPEEKLVVDCDCNRIILKMPKEWPHYGMAGALGSHEQRVKIRQQSVTEFDILLADGLYFCPVGPGLLVVGSDIGM